jgi:ABC-type glutathione transport system ATPase component
MSEQPTLEVKQYSVVRDSDDLEVLKGVQLEVRPGEVVGLVGESGAGKTVLLDAVLGMVPFPHRATGTIAVAGSPVTGASEHDLGALRGRTMALIPSGGRHHLAPSTRVGRQMTRLARVHLGIKRDAATELAREWLERVNISDPVRRLRAYPHELSGGMAQRVLIAMALMREPRLVLADEPTSGLDVTIQKQVLDLLVELVAAQGSACLIVTRDLGIVAQYCSRVNVLANGAIVESRGVPEFFADPQSAAGHRMLELVRGERVASAFEVSEL